MAIDGTWNLTMQSPMGARDVKAELTSDGGAIGGAFTGAQGSAPVTGTIDGNAAKFSATVPGPMGELALSFDGTLDGDSISGTVQFGAFGSGAFSGSKA